MCNPRSDRNAPMFFLPKKAFPEGDQPRFIEASEVDALLDSVQSEPGTEWERVVWSGVEPRFVIPLQKIEEREAESANGELRLRFQGALVVVLQE